jgi:type IV pilus assembly protein PilO
MKKNNAFATFIDDKYIPLDKKFKWIIAVILFLLPGVLFYFFLFQPQQVKTSQLTTRRATLTEELKKAKAKAANRGKLQAELKVIEERFAEAALLLPKEKEIPALLTNISALGRGVGLDFLTFKPQQDVPRDFYSEIPVDIQVRGPYHSMGAFLDQVSKLNRIVTVSNITMGGPTKEAGEMLLNSSCRLVTYRFTNKKLPEKPKK